MLLYDFWLANRCYLILLNFEYCLFAAINLNMESFSQYNFLRSSINMCVNIALFSLLNCTHYDSLARTCSVRIYSAD